jgi:vancomycin resistance protein VanJ
MATLTIRCECGEQYHASDDSIGRQIQCRQCRRVLVVTRPEPMRASAAAPRAPAAKSAGPARKRRRKQSEEFHRQPNTGSGADARVILPWSRPRWAPQLARTVAVLSWAYLAVVCMSAIVMWTLGDRTIVGTVLLFIGRWVFLLPLTVLAPAALYYRRLLLLPLVAAGLVVVGPIMGTRTGWRRLLPAAAGPHVRVVSFNTNAAEFAAVLLPDFLEQWKPDIVAFQECSAQLGAALQMITGWNHHESQDLCLLSRFPIRSAEVMDRSTLDRVRQSEATEIGGSGFVVRFVLDTPHGPIRVGSLHLETPRKGLEGLVLDGDFRRLRLNTQIREIESRLARRWVSQGTGPLIVLGDFNTPVESRIFQADWGDLADAFSTAGTGLGMTKYNGWIRARIDHVLASKEWHVDRATVGADAHSDHRPLIVDLTLVAK